MAANTFGTNENQIKTALKSSYKTALSQNCCEPRLPTPRAAAVGREWEWDTSK
jgi:hypothetical protein